MRMLEQIEVMENTMTVLLIPLTIAFDNCLHLIDDPLSKLVNTHLFRVSEVCRDFLKISQFSSYFHQGLIPYLKFFIEAIAFNIDVTKHTKNKDRKIKGLRVSRMEISPIN